MKKKSQTATEYMIILAVVLVISLIAVSNLGIIPGIGGNSGSRSNDAQLKSGKIGVMSYSIDDDKTIAIIQNNEAEILTITSFYLKGIECSNFNQITLSPGQKRTIECDNIDSSDGTMLGKDIPIRFIYTTSRGATFNEDYGKFELKEWECGDSITYHGDSYSTTLIGLQCWLAENLRNELDAESDSITRYCYDNDANNCNLYGGLYDWDVMMNGAASSNTDPSEVQGICPDGWHIPSNKEFDNLILYVGINPGKKLKSCRNSGSATGNPECDNQDHPRWVYHATAFGTDEYGFNALPAGYRNTDLGIYYLQMGTSIDIWSSTEFSLGNAYSLYLTVGGLNTQYNTESKTNNFYSVRCVKD
jgi:uncharacterized protein (TIGR02145 family)